MKNENINDEGLKLLAVAVIKQAAADIAKKGTRYRETTEREIEQSNLQMWFDLLKIKKTPLDLFEAAKNKRLRITAKEIRKTPTKRARDTNEKQCEKCLFRATRFDRNGGHRCEYIILTGKRRPCDVPPNCTVFEKYDRDKRVKLKIYAAQITGDFMKGEKQ